MRIFTFARDNECPHIRRKLANDETYDICELNTKFCLIEHGLYECRIWNIIKKERVAEADPWAEAKAEDYGSGGDSGE